MRCGVLLLALLAAVAVKVPALFGFPMDDSTAPVYLRNASLFVLPLLSGYFAWKRGINLVGIVWMGLAFAAAALFVNVYPFGPDADTHWLSVIHLPIASWLVVGFAYAGGHWFASGRRMDFVRFTGELADLLRAHRPRRRCADRASR